MSCNLTITTTKCIPCIHPLEYLFEFVALGLANQGNRDPFSISLNFVLDKGIVQPNCKLCCGDCGGLYAFASVETMLKLFEGIQISNSEYTGCCSNIFASGETYLKYAEAVGITPAIPAAPGPLSAVITDGAYVNSCCNGFNECLEEFICWNTKDAKNPGTIVDRFQDKGIVEFGNIVNNCTGTGGSSICKLTELLNQYVSADKNANKYLKENLSDIILDKGIAIYCNPDTGDITIASVETMLKYLEATS